MEEEDIDNETLQAKVDASLAYVNDLVSSWMKPPKNPSPSRRDVEKEIEQLMRLPPRLGVGAQPPESTSISGCEAMRLKGRLVSKKRGREDDEGAKKTSSSDEDESRASAIQKKAKLGLFEEVGKKKKRKVSMPQQPPDPGPSAALYEDNKHSKPSTTVESSPQKSHKKKKVKKQNTEHGAPAEPATSNTSNTAFNPTTSIKIPVSPKMPHLTAEDSAGDDEYDYKIPCPASISKPISHHMGNSVLNLNGPPPEPVGSLNQSPKKKRKKRKKKKHVDESTGQ